MIVSNNKTEGEHPADSLPSSTLISQNMEWLPETFEAVSQGIGLGPHLRRKMNPEPVLSHLDEQRLDRIVQPLALHRPAEVSQQLIQIGGPEVLFSDPAQQAIAIWGKSYQTVPILREAMQSVSTLLKAHRKGELASRPKAVKDRVSFTVPLLVTVELWQRANQNLLERGRGRGKQGKVIPALLRSRIYCPRCGKPMAVARQRGSSQGFYYYCRAHYCYWIKNPCLYNHFVPGARDNEIWEEIGRLLKDDSWIERQLSAETHQDESLDKLIRLQQFKIKQWEDKIHKVGEGFDGGLYSLAEANKKRSDYQALIDQGTQELNNLKAQTGGWALAGAIGNP
jgi:hypothetical protein